MKKIFNNYEVFYEMVLVTTLMSNCINDEYIKDAKEVIQFIGESYSLDLQTINEFSKIILEDLSDISLITDKEAEQQRKHYETHFDLMDNVKEIKCSVLDEIEATFERIKKYSNRNSFDYNSYKMYNAQVRFHELNALGVLGIVKIVKTLAIFHYLGIGCEKNINKAIIRLKQCVYWGDISAMHFLTNVYKQQNDSENYDVMNEVTKLATEYMSLGLTVLPKDINYTEKAKEMYVYISSIYQDVVRASNLDDIVFSFVEAILLENLGYNDRMRLINNFSRGEWKELTNAYIKENIKIGF